MGDDLAAFFRAEHLHLGSQRFATNFFERSRRDASLPALSDEAASARSAVAISQNSL
jgi:hypothetical protein